MKPHPDYGFDVMSEGFQKDTGGKGHKTYLHAVAGKGWPYDHKAEDAFELPPLERPAPINDHRITLLTDPQYSAAYTGSGKVILVLSTPDRTIAYFDTFADAQTAAEALNNHKGY